MGAQESGGSPGRGEAGDFLGCSVGSSGREHQGLTSSVSGAGSSSLGDMRDMADHPCTGPWTLRVTPIAGLSLRQKSGFPPLAYAFSEHGGGERVTLGACGSEGRWDGGAQPLGRPLLLLGLQPLLPSQPFSLLLPLLTLLSPCSPVWRGQMSTVLVTRHRLPPSTVCTVPCPNPGCPAPASPGGLWATASLPYAGAEAADPFPATAAPPMSSPRLTPPHTL